MDWYGADRAVFRGVYDVDLPSILVAGITHLATRGGVWLLAGLALLVLGRGLTRRAGMALLTGLVLHVLLIEGALKHAVQRERPFAALGLTLRDGLVDPTSYSFPSGHSTASFLGAWILGLAFPRWRWPLLTLAALIALSRVSLGAHYPSDVTAGALIGLMLALIVGRAFGLERAESADPALR